MRLMFVYWRTSNAGSAQTIRHYAEAARELGHEVVIYALPDPAGRFPCTLDIGSTDAVIFVLEYNLFLYPGGEKKSATLKTGLMGIGEVNIMRLSASCRANGGSSLITTACTASRSR